MIDPRHQASGCWSTVWTKPYLALRLLALLAFVAIATGCDDGREEQVRVTGVVLYEGEPIEGARVTFQRKGARPASGVTNSEGVFTLRTYQPDDGAVIGTHAVAISKSERNPNYDLTNPDKMFVDLLPLRYAQPHTSELTAEVAADGENNFRFELTE